MNQKRNERLSFKKTVIPNGKRGKILQKLYQNIMLGLKQQNNTNGNIPGYMIGENQFQFHIWMKLKKKLLKIIWLIKKQIMNDGEHSKRQCPKKSFKLIWTKMPNGIEIEGPEILKYV